MKKSYCGINVSEHDKWWWFFSHPEAVIFQHYGEEEDWIYLPKTHGNGIKNRKH